LAVLKRMKFGAKAERYSPEQASLRKEAVETDIEALTCELDGIAQGVVPTGGHLCPHRHGAATLHAGPVGCRLSMP
jgi:hypothetical protein